MHAAGVPAIDGEREDYSKNDGECFDDQQFNANLQMQRLSNDEVQCCW